MPTNSPNLWPDVYRASFLILGIVMLLIILLSRFPFWRRPLPHRNLIRAAVILLVVILTGCSIFIVDAKIMSTTSINNPPHGIRFGVWDNFASDGSEVVNNGLVIIDPITNLDLTVDTDNTPLIYISNERFIRYLVPPAFRHRCYTNNWLGCTWTEIDVNNYPEWMQMSDYLSRIYIGLASGLIVGLFTLLLTRQTKLKLLNTAG